MDHLCTKPNDDHRPSLLGSAVAFAFPLLILMFAAVVIALVCEGLAKLAMPLPAGASPEIQQSVANQREAVAKLMFALFWALIIVWATFFS